MMLMTPPPATRCTSPFAESAKGVELVQAGILQALTKSCALSGTQKYSLARPVALRR